jgi:hypothetical protein
LRECVAGLSTAVELLELTLFQGRPTFFAGPFTGLAPD